jgi:hypothetical protein
MCGSAYYFWLRGASTPLHALGSFNGASVGRPQLIGSTAVNKTLSLSEMLCRFSMGFLDARTWRRLRTRYERRDGRHETFLTIGCRLISSDFLSPFKS